MKRFCSAIILTLLACAFGLPTGYASGIEDIVATGRSIESRYFSISVENGVNLNELTMAISVPPSIKSIIRQPLTEYSDFNLASQMDILYLAVSEILDIHMSKFKCKVIVCKNAQSLSSAASRLFGADIPRTAGFYVAQTNALYVNAEDISINVLGHELSHAIQTSYFVIPPPVTIQEVLSGYVEFQFRKYTKTLPARNEAQI